MTTSFDIQDFIEKSGNSFHAKVAQSLGQDSWHLQVSPYYLDPVQEKAREVDLIAEKIWSFEGGKFNAIASHVIVRLYIECKYIDHTHTVFWFADKNMEEANALVCSRVFRKNNTYTKQHHYLNQSPKVAKLFSSHSSKGQETDPFYKALNQILSAFVAFRGSGLFSHPLQSQQLGKTVLLEFPVIVCSSFQEVYSVDFFDQQATNVLKVQDNFQLEVRYAYRDSSAKKNEYFLIDVASYDTLHNLLAAIQLDAETAAIFV